MPMNMDNEPQKSGWINPLPFIMLVLLAGGMLVKNIPLESSRPAATERVKFVPIGEQNVEARLWQDPFAAIEEHEKQLARPTSSAQPLTGQPDGASTPAALQAKLETLRSQSVDIKVLAVSVFGDSYAESAESRRRTRYAVISALGSHDFYPESSNAIGYLRLPWRQSEPSPMHAPAIQREKHLTIPFEWFNHKNTDAKVLLLWLNESLYAPNLVFEELPAHFGELSLIGPAGSTMLLALSGHASKLDDASRTRIKIFSPTATIDNCVLSEASGQEMLADRRFASWRCFSYRNEHFQRLLADKRIIRTIGTDDVLAVSLLWELWQRGINREQRWTLFSEQTSAPCQDGLVLISEWDSAYARSLTRNFSESFGALCQTRNGHPSPLRNFTYLRGLDGALPGLDSKPTTKTTRKTDDSHAQNLRAQLDTAAPELAEGLSQYDYLRRLVDEIALLDRDPQFAPRGIQAIGIVGSDVYDKLLILQALRSRFKGKIFFTTDLDARFLHADQKDWTRNLVIASNFGLTLHPLLQRSALPFRDGYQTSTYLATLMALAPLPLDYWEQSLRQWLRPAIYEIGRTAAIPIASPAVDDLIRWIDGIEPDGASPVIEPAPCADWTTCEQIAPPSPLAATPARHWLLLLIGGLLAIWVAISSQRFQKAISAMIQRPAPAALQTRIGTVAFWSLVLTIVTLLTIIIVGKALQRTLAQSTGEPFIWLEGISVWPNLTLRFVGFITVLALILAFLVHTKRQAQEIAHRFDLSLPTPWSLARSRLAAIWNGPNLDLTTFDARGRPGPPASELDVSTLWQNYLRATNWHEQGGWIAASAVIVFLLSLITFSIFDIPSFPHRGELVKSLHYILLGLTIPLLWLSILWIGYENRACTQFVEALGKVRRLWPESLLKREASETGIPQAYLDHYLGFQLIVAATQRIQALVYLPFISLFFTVIARSDLFDTMDFPLPLLLIVLVALFYTLYTARLLRKSAENLRTQVLTHYDLLLLKQAQPQTQTQPHLSTEQINRLLNQIRATRQGAFAAFSQRPVLSALLLPFGGFGGTQLIDYLFTF
ncbi:hypothetical protein [Nitrosomonas sp. ANs5]|uniref:hypothetical protein n=1 Tax=Nitrosomonas sp. ANs5 TaxID=3423941 RepID=UPI003D336523